MTTAPVMTITDEQIAEIEDYCAGKYSEDFSMAHNLGLSDILALISRLRAAEKDADRYRWLRDPDQDVSLVIDKVTGEIPADEFGCGGYRTYEYRAGEELDAAIDAAMEQSK